MSRHYDNAIGALAQMRKILDAGGAGAFHREPILAAAGVVGIAFMGLTSAVLHLAEVVKQDDRPLGAAPWKCRTCGKGHKTKNCPSKPDE